MNVPMGKAATVPISVSLFSPIIKFLLAVGVPLGFNRLVTIPGRKSGLPRTVAVAVLEVSGRRWVWAPWGEVNWVRNLRAARRATVNVRGRKEEVRATELDPTQRVEFFRDVLGPFARTIPFGAPFIRIVDGVNLDHPVEAAEGRRVFELHPIRIVRPSTRQTGRLARIYRHLRPGGVLVLQLFDPLLDAVAPFDGVPPTTDRGIVVLPDSGQV